MLINDRFSRGHLWLALVLFISVLGGLLISLAPNITLMHPHPIKMELIRSAWAKPCQKTASVAYGFATLESFNRQGKNNHFALYEKGCGDISSTRAKVGSAEGRFYFEGEETSFLASSQFPSMIEFLPFSGLSTLNSKLKVEANGIWILQAGMIEDKIAVLYSNGENIELNKEEITILELRTNMVKQVPLKCPALKNSKYRGVQTVGPLGNVWFYTAYPIGLHEVNLESGVCESRQIAEFPNADVVAWELVRRKDGREAIHLILLNEDMGLFRVFREEDQSHSLVKDHKEKLIKLDVYSTRNRSIEDTLYVDLEGKIYNCNHQACSSHPGNISTQNLVLQTSRELSDKPLLLLHESYGPLEVIYGDEDTLIYWVYGTKSVIVSRENLEVVHTGEFENLDSADITALNMLANGSIVGGGYLTNSAIFYMPQDTLKSKLLNKLVPFSQGQVESLAVDNKGNLYGALYPDVIRFRINLSNVICTHCMEEAKVTYMPPLGVYSQHRPLPFGSFVDEAGVFWVASRSDYSQETVYSISSTDFDSMKTKALNSIDHQLPELLSVADFDTSHLLFVGTEGNDSKVYSLSKKTLKYYEINHLKNCNGVLASALSEAAPSMVLLGCGSNLYRIDAAFTSRALATVPFEIKRILISGDYAFLLSKYAISRINLYNGNKDVVFSPIVLQSFFADEHWLAATPSGGDLVYSDGIALKLLKF